MTSRATRKQWDGVLPTLLRRHCATLVGENITDQPEDEENSPCNYSGGYGQGVANHLISLAQYVTTFGTFIR